MEEISPEEIEKARLSDEIVDELMKITMDYGIKTHEKALNNPIIGRDVMIGMSATFLSLALGLNYSESEKKIITNLIIKHSDKQLEEAKKQEQNERN